jgi:hypothetical protein
MRLMESYQVNDYMIEEPERPQHDLELIEQWLIDPDSVAGPLEAEIWLPEVYGKFPTTYTINGPVCHIVALKRHAKENGAWVYSQGYGVTERVEHADLYSSGYLCVSGPIEWETKPDFFDDQSDQKDYTGLLNHVTHRALQLLRRQGY